MRAIVEQDHVHRLRRKPCMIVLARKQPIGFSSRDLAYTITGEGIKIEQARNNPRRPRRKLWDKYEQRWWTVEACEDPDCPEPEDLRPIVDKNLGQGQEWAMALRHEGGAYESPLIHVAHQNLVTAYSLSTLVQEISPAPRFVYDHGSMIKRIGFEVDPDPMAALGHETYGAEPLVVYSSVRVTKLDRQGENYAG